MSAELTHSLRGCDIVPVNKSVGPVRVLAHEGSSSGRNLTEVAVFNFTERINMGPL